MELVTQAGIRLLATIASGPGKVKLPLVWYCPARSLTPSRTTYYSVRAYVIVRTAMR